MIKRTLFFFLSLSLIITIFSFVNDDNNTSIKNHRVVKTIIIDPGHGGSDEGAKGQYSFEKDICLSVSLKLGKLIEEEFPDIKLLYTRTTDTYPELHTRANFANTNKGDLFLCVHVNSAPPIRHSELTGYKTVTYYIGKGKKRKKKTKQVPQYRYWTTPSLAKGTETYIWGAHKSDEKELAVRENAPMLAEENFDINYGGIDPNSPEFIALSLLKTKQFFKRSATLAGFVQDEFVKIGRVDREVRQRGVGIWVLQATAMPSVLVETGFISNPEEEKYLNSNEGQAELSECIVKALGKYLSWLEEKNDNVEKDEKVINSSKNNGDNSSVKNTAAFLRMVEENEKKKLSK